MKKIFLCLFLSFYTTYVFARDIDRFAAMVSSIHDSYSAHEKNWLYPDFSDLYQRSFARYFSTELAAPAFWEPLLETVTKQNGLIVKPVHVIEIDDQADIILIGDLFGSVHALWDYIREGYFLGFIDKNLKIQNKKNYIIFLGNVVNKSPHSIETLSLILQLMKQNPGHVLLTQGDEEFNDNWKNNTLYDEIFYTRTYQSKSVHHEDLFSKFFASCPIAIVLKSSQKKSQIVWISSSLNKKRFNDSLFGLSSVCAYITGLQLFMAKADHTGLIFDFPIEGATHWSLFSAATPFIKEFMQTNVLSFGLLRYNKNPSQSILYHIYRPEKDKAFSLKSYDFIKGIPLDLLPKKTVKIGSSMDLSGVLYKSFQHVQKSVHAAVQNFNNQKDAPYIREYLFDDGYVPARSLKNIERLMSEGIDSILFPSGSVAFELYKKYIKSGDITVYFPMVQDRVNDTRHVIFLRQNYNQEVRVSLEYIVNTSSVKKCALFYQNDAYGLPMAQEAHRILSQKNIEYIDLPYELSSATSFKDHAQKFKASSADVIALYATPEAAQRFLAEISTADLISTKICAPSPMFMADFLKFISSRGLHVILSSTVPSPWDAVRPIARQYRAAMKEYGYAFDTISFESYIATRLFLRAFTHNGYNVHFDGIMKFFEEMQKYDFEGLKLSFDPQTRQLMHSVWIAPNQKDPWIEYFVDPVNGKIEQVLKQKAQ